MSAKEVKIIGNQICYDGRTVALLNEGVHPSTLQEFKEVITNDYYIKRLEAGKIMLKNWAKEFEDASSRFTEAAEELNDLEDDLEA